MRYYVLPSLLTAKQNKQPSRKVVLRLPIQGNKNSIAHSNSCFSYPNQASLYLLYFNIYFLLYIPLLTQSSWSLVWFPIWIFFPIYIFFVIREYLIIKLYEYLPNHRLPTVFTERKIKRKRLKSKEFHPQKIAPQKYEIYLVALCQSLPNPLCPPIIINETSQQDR